MVRLRIPSRAPKDANSIRGQFGKALRRFDRDAYDRLFAPRQIDGPSGLHDSPRPFVLRVAERHVDVHLFDPGASIDLIARALEADRVESCDRLSLPLHSTLAASKIRVEFLTPTELKGGNGPEFGVLFARIRDRISTLRALYQGGPVEIDFTAMGERATRVEMTRCEIQHVDAERTSRATGQTHSLGGFIGVAEYEGDLGEFLPYLEIARWTGVGRQTVWGKGEIACEITFPKRGAA